MLLMKGHKRFKQAVKYADINTGDSILDLGSGEGLLWDYLPEGINYVSIDSNNEAMINHDLEKGLPKRIGKFDRIFLLEVLEYIFNYKKLLQECKKHLKYNGRIIITTPTNNCFIRLPNSTHCFRKQHLINLANQLNMDYLITGVHIRIPFFNIFIPSWQMIYNDTFLMVMKNNGK